MTEKSYYWGGQVVGDAIYAPYSDDDWSDIWRKHFQADRTTQGIVPAYANELEVTNPVGLTIRMDTGAALVDGKYYENDATKDFTVAVPGVGVTNYYTLVLRKSWAAQTVRAVMLGPSTVTFPSVTQTDGTTWEIAIGNVSVDDAGVVSVGETRHFAPVTETVILISRQGGHATDWATAGTTGYRPGAFRSEAGTLAGEAAASGDIDVTFDIGFQGTPIVFACISGIYTDTADADDYKLICQVANVNASSFRLLYRTTDASVPDNTWTVSWIAYGIG